MKRYWKRGIFIKNNYNPWREENNIVIKLNDFLSAEPLGNSMGTIKSYSKVLDSGTQKLSAFRLKCVYSR